MVAFSLAIPFVNRPDLLRLAVNSIRPLWSGALILDNSADGVVEREADQWPVEVKWFRGISLTFSQSMNFLFNEAWCRESQVCFFMHNDAEAEPGTAEKLLAAVDELIASGRKWGVAFTNYDTLAAFNMQAVEEVGA